MGSTIFAHLRADIEVNNEPNVIYQDNKSTILLAEKGCSASSKSRHINLKFFHIKDRIAAGELRLEYLSTEQMIADILTKPLQGQLFRNLRLLLLGNNV